jgi:hypothetical protein
MHVIHKHLIVLMFLRIHSISTYIVPYLSQCASYKQEQARSFELKKMVDLSRGKHICFDIFLEQEIWNRVTLICNQALITAKQPQSFACTMNSNHQTQCKTLKPLDSGTYEVVINLANPKKITSIRKCNYTR